MRLSSVLHYMLGTKLFYRYCAQFDGCLPLCCPHCAKFDVSFLHFDVYGAQSDGCLLLCACYCARFDGC